jgi:hypothetical protein
MLMESTDFPAEWLMVNIIDHSSVSEAQQISSRCVILRRMNLDPVTVIPVSIPMLEVVHVDELLNEEIATIICLIPRISHYNWAAREEAIRRGSTVHTFYELNASLSYEDPRPFRKKSVAKIQSIVGMHRQVQSVQMECEAAMRIKRKKNLGDVTIVVEEVYDFGEEALMDALERHPDVDAVVNGNPSGSFTKSARDFARNIGVGVFSLQELMGALNYAGSSFLKYQPADRDR